MSQPEFLYVRDAKTGDHVAIQLVALGGGISALAISDLGGPTQSFGYQQITDLSSSVTLEMPDGVTQATITVEGQPIRYRLDGIDPTADIGMPVQDGSTVIINGRELAGFRAIEQSAGAILNVIFEG